MAAKKTIAGRVMDFLQRSFALTSFTATVGLGAGVLYALKITRDRRLAYEATHDVDAEYAALKAKEAKEAEERAQRLTEEGLLPFQQELLEKHGRAKKDPVAVERVRREALEAKRKALLEAEEKKS